MQKSMDQVIGQFMLWSPVVSRRLADRSFTAGNDFTGQSQPGRFAVARFGSRAEIKADDIGRPGNAQPAVVKLGNFGVIDNRDTEVCLSNLKLGQRRGEQVSEISLPHREPPLAVAAGDLPASRRRGRARCRPSPGEATP